MNESVFEEFIGKTMYMVLLYFLSACVLYLYFVKLPGYIFGIILCLLAMILLIILLADKGE
jgi:hypothetical protein